MFRLGWLVAVVFCFASPSLGQKAPAAKPDAPKADAPKADAPKADAPKAEAPKADAPMADAPKPETAAKSDSPGQAVEQYDRAFAEWKEMLAKLRDLRVQWATARPKARKPIEDEYQALVKQAEDLEVKMIAAAEAAVACDSDKKTEASKFLAEQLKYEVERDNYEAAYPIARVLVEHDYGNPRIYNYGGLAAACTNHFDEAQRWLKEGDKHSVLDVTQKQYLQHIDEYQELWHQEQELREAEAKADDLPRVLLKTTKGDLVIELFENEAPNTVANFLTLVEKGYFDGTEFHRVMPHFMAQG
ncbi:MAG TPA: peptidylprolyl isomerase, partial [Pirellulales bacterium]|nr:peptidylprolyl isomerase [Pirellulales bacterium]